jgi:RNA polymerase sigma factor (sigma-70 family)
MDGRPIVANGQLGRVLGHIRKLVGGRPFEAGNDGQLLQRFVKSREEAAFALLVERHGPMVRAVCRRVLQNDHDADDAFQATFLVLARKAGAIRKLDSVGSWLYGTAYRLAQKMRAGAARRQARHGPGTAPPEATAVFPQATSDTDRLEMRALLDQELDRLPEKYRAPLVLCYLEGRTNEEAAEQLNWPVGTVSGRLARARDLLRVRLGRRGLTLPATALAAVLTEQLAAAALPASLTQATIQSAVLFANGSATAAGIASARATAAAEGVLKAMWMTKLKVACVLFLVVGLAAGAAVLTYRTQARAVPLPEKEEQTRVEEKGKTDPAGVPLELKLVARKRRYVFQSDQLGKTPEEYRKELEGYRAAGSGFVAPEPPAVDLVLEFRNTGAKELIFQLGGNTTDYVTVPHLDGPGAVNLVWVGRYNRRALVPPVEVKLAAGATHELPIRQLKSGPEVTQPSSISYSYWTQGGGEFKLHFTMDTVVSPAPAGSKDAGNGFGRVKLTSNTVNLEVVDAKAQGKTDPPGVPLEMRLVARKNRYTLDLGGKTEAEFRAHVEKNKQGVGPFQMAPAPAPRVDLILEFRNTSMQAVEVWVAGVPDPELTLDLQGPSPLTIHGSYGELKPREVPSSAVRIDAGKTHEIPIQHLHTHQGDTIHYWCRPGEYTLTAQLRTALSPAPANSKQAARGFGRVTLTAEPVKIQVVDARDQGKSDPPGVPLELKLTAKKDSYTLDLGGKTPEEFRKLLAAAKSGDAPIPPTPAVDLELVIKNVSNKQVTFWASGDPVEVLLNLEGKGAVSIAPQLVIDTIFIPPNPVTLGPGKTHSIPLKNLNYGFRKVAGMAYWTKPGDYELTAQFSTGVIPRPKDSKDEGMGAGRAVLTSNPVTLKVTEEK